MNRLSELQDAGGAATFSPQNSSAFEPPSAAPADDNRKAVTFVGIADASDDFNNNRNGNDDDDDHGNNNSNDNKTGHSNRGDAYVVVSDETLDKALKIIEEIQAGNREIQAKTMALRVQTAQNMKNFNPAGDADEGGDAIQDIMDAVGVTSKMVKAKIDELNEGIKELQKDEETKADNAGTIKIQQNQSNHLTRQFMQYINEYNNAVSDNEKGLREQAIRRIKLKYTKSDGSTVSDEEARSMAAQVLETGRTDMLFQASKEMLAQVLETRQDIMRIERSMRELKQIMDDLSSLINEQGEIMDQVLANVQNSVQYVKSGREKLKSAREYSKSASGKMKWIVMCICLIVILVLAMILGFTLPT